MVCNLQQCLHVNTPMPQGTNVWFGQKKISKINDSTAMLTKVNTEQQRLESPPMEGQARASSGRTGLGEL